MEGEVLVRRVHELPVGLDRLVAASAGEGLRFLERLRAEWDSGSNRFEGPGEALFAGRIGSELAGICGLNRDPYAGDPRVGRLRRLYVLPAFRGQGVGRRLVGRVLSAARGRFDRVRLRTDQPGAVRFYEALGFVPTRSPEATHEWRERRRGHPG